MGEIQKMQTLNERFAVQIPKLDACAATCAELAVTKSGAFGEVFALAGATTELRGLLSEELVNAAIMPLQGTKIGFNTDRVNAKNGPQVYPVAVVRDVCIWAMMNGARMIGNEVNIIGGNGYLTKEFFMRALDEVDGLEYRFNHALPVPTKDGAVVRTVITWNLDGKGDQTETIERAIKGGQYAGPDLYLGKMDRKAGAWLLAAVTGRRFSDGDADEIPPGGPVIEGTATSPIEVTPPVEVTPAPTEPGGLTAADICEGAGLSNSVDFLRSINWLENEGSVEDLTESHCASIAQKPADFKAQVAKYIADRAAEVRAADGAGNSQ